MKPNRKIMKDQFIQNAREDNQELVVLDKISKQFKATPVQSPLMSIFFFLGVGMESKLQNSRSWWGVTHYRYWSYKGRDSNF